MSDVHLTGKLLEEHHKATVTTDTRHLIILNELSDGFLEILLDLRRHHTLLAHFECETWHYTVENIVVKGLGAVHVTWCSWVIIVETNDAEVGVVPLRIDLFHLLVLLNFLVTLDVLSIGQLLLRNDLVHSNVTELLE